MPLKPLLLRLHRWITLVFALPLLGVIGTGLVLSVEPLVVSQAAKPGTLTLEMIEATLAAHDLDGKARSLTYRAYENRLSIGGVRTDDTLDVDVRTNQELEDEGRLSALFYQARMIHESLIGDLGKLVTASTIALLVLALLGVAMGWPRLRNTVSGWHQATAWGALPLLVLSPLTGLALAFGITFLPPATPSSGQRPPLRDAVAQIARSHDLSGLIWIRPRANGHAVRLLVDGEYRVYPVTASGVGAPARNWPRLIHEGTWGGYTGPLLNVFVSTALLGLAATGLWLWAKRRFRRRPQRRDPRLQPAE